MTCKDFLLLYMLASWDKIKIINIVDFSRMLLSIKFRSRGILPFSILQWSFFFMLWNAYIYLYVCKQNANIFTKTKQSKCFLFIICVGKKPTITWCFIHLIVYVSSCYLIQDLIPFKFQILITNYMSHSNLDERPKFDQGIKNSDKIFA